MSRGVLAIPPKYWNAVDRSRILLTIDHATLVLTQGRADRAMGQVAALGFGVDKAWIQRRMAEDGLNGWGNIKATGRDKKQIAWPASNKQSKLLGPKPISQFPSGETQPQK